ncbi:hypothetical protein [Saccharopolyspora rosea]|uniref:hypothetical protein n=1 Tax=Saccharopolyspora rosea TaxID=524884 RepID=UPI0021D9BAF7|nr:hypothetical protein [Saccharopolyspora rosea]
MSYDPYGGPHPHRQQNHGYYPQHDEYREGYSAEYRHRHDGAETVANIIRVVVGLVVAVFALHVLFVVFHANHGNEFVSAVYTLAKALVLGLGDVFTPNDAVLGVVLNYGLAALVYVIVGQLVITLLRRR